MKTYQPIKRTAAAHRRRRQCNTALPPTAIAPGPIALTPRPAADRRPHAAHDFLALCLYPGMAENHTAA